VALWNLQRLADALSSLIDKGKLTKALEAYQEFLVKEYTSLMRRKFGLAEVTKGDSDLINDFLQLLYSRGQDYSRSMRLLSQQGVNNLGDAFDTWFERYDKRLTSEASSVDERALMMNGVNPKFILRNYLAEVAIRKAEDLYQYDEIDTLFNLLKNPFDEHPGFESYTHEAPDWAKNLSVSCSS
jgi:hypothetical protein